MSTWSITTRGKPPVTVRAPNWLMAMGSGITALDEPDTLDRLACEMLQNGTVIARDARGGKTFIIRPLSEPEPVEDEVITASDEPTEEMTGELFAMEGDPEEEETQIEERDFGLLSQRLAAIEATDSADVAWALALEAALVLAPCEAGAAIEDRGDAGLVFTAAVGDQAGRLLGRALPAGTGLVGFCIDRLVSLTIHDVRRDARHYPALDDETGFTTRSVMCVPVAREGRTWGCVELINPPPDGRFTRAQLELVSMVSATLALRLFDLEAGP